LERAISWGNGQLLVSGKQSEKKQLRPNDSRAAVVSPGDIWKIR
jgi:hypothetical protein